MIRTGCGRAVLLTFALALVPSIAAGQVDTPLEDLMSADVFRATGIAKLTEAERTALERWLGQYLDGVRQLTQTAGEGYGERAPQERFTVNHRVVHRLSGGQVLILEDWTIWAINPLDRHRTTGWSPVDEITVGDATAPLGTYRFWLANKAQGNQVLARYVGKR